MTDSERFEDELHRMGLSEQARLHYYIPDADWNPVPCGLFEWAEWVERRENTVEHTTVHNVRISTVFLGVEQPGGMFETMCFSDEATIEALVRSTSENISSIITNVFGGFDVQTRYHTVAEARAGHEQMVKFVKQFFATRN